MVNMADSEVLKWWHRNETKLPNWVNACEQVLLVQPSSAAVERVFSLLQNSFQKQQESAMEDYIKSSLMLQCNKRNCLFLIIVLQKI